MKKIGRPKLSKLEKNRRLAKRLLLKIRELEKQIDLSEVVDSRHTIGRPKLTNKDKLEKLNKEYKLCLSHVIEEEQRRKIEHIDIMTIKDPVLRGKGVGRPRKSFIMGLDYKLMGLLKQRQLLLFKHHKEKAPTISKKGKVLGRPSFSLDTKLAKINEKIKKTQDLIDIEEKKLPAKEKIYHKKKQLENRLKFLDYKEKYSDLLVIESIQNERENIHKLISAIQFSDI